MRVASRLAWGLVLVALATPAQASGAPSGDRAWLALGDSYSSGEGLREALGGCQRADAVNTPASAWSAAAYGELRRELGFSRLDFVACTGAIADDAVGQLGEARRASGRRQFDLVTLSFGGNNVGFVDVLRGCLDLDHLPWGVFDRTPGCDVGEQQLRRRIDMLTGATPIDARQYQGSTTLPALYARVAAGVAPGGDVIVTGYPNLVEETGRWDGWRRNLLGSCEGIKDYDVGMLRSVTGYLNQGIGQAVADADARYEDRGVHFHFVDISRDPYEYGGDAGARHGLCSRAPWLNGRVIGGRIQRSFHPNQAGHTSTGRVVAGLIRDQVDLDDAPAPPALSGPLTFNGLPPVYVGMTPAQAGTALGRRLRVPGAGYGNGCETVPLGGPTDRYGGPGISMMVTGNTSVDAYGMPRYGRVARVTITARGVPTAAGIQVGDTEAEVRAAYGLRVRVTPHQYYRRGHYLNVSSPDPALAGYLLVIETDDSGTVRVMHGGRIPEVQYVEGCA